MPVPVPEPKPLPEVKVPVPPSIPEMNRNNINSEINSKRQIMKKANELTDKKFVEYEKKMIIIENKINQIIELSNSDELKDSYK